MAAYSALRPASHRHATGRLNIEPNSRKCAAIVADSMRCRAMFQSAGGELGEASVYSISPSVEIVRRRLRSNRSSTSVARMGGFYWNCET